MRVFGGGASAAVGTRLVPLVIAAGHEAIRSASSPGGAARVRALTAEPVVLDLLDSAAVRKAVVEAQPDAIVNQTTALANVRLQEPRPQLRADQPAAPRRARGPGRESGVRRGVAERNRGGD
jgi:dTDP-4-dehydrorhamnose reductase